MSGKGLIPCLFFVLTVGTLSPILLSQGPACPDERSPHFGFWIGQWEVYSGDTAAGTNSIRLIQDGCVLQEDWKGSRGNKGCSFNFYNPATSQWQQFWVWRNGTTLDLSGSFEDKRMVLSGESKDREGREVLNRITWTNGRDGTVRLHWETSGNHVETWCTIFEGLYKKKN